MREAGLWWARSPRPRLPRPLRHRLVMGARVAPLLRPLRRLLQLVRFTAAALSSRRHRAAPCASRLAQISTMLALLSTPRTPRDASTLRPSSHAVTVSYLSTSIATSARASARLIPIVGRCLAHMAIARLLVQRPDSERNRNAHRRLRIHLLTRSHCKVHNELRHPHDALVAVVLLGHRSAHHVCTGHGLRLMFFM